MIIIIIFVSIERLFSREIAHILASSVHIILRGGQFSYDSEKLF